VDQLVPDGPGGVRPLTGSNAREPNFGRQQEGLGHGFGTGLALAGNVKGGAMRRVVMGDGKPPAR
jgi:hypothetical protein